MPTHTPIVPFRTRKKSIPHIFPMVEKQNDGRYGESLFGIFFSFNIMELTQLFDVLYLSSFPISGACDQKVTDVIALFPIGNA